MEKTLIQIFVTETIHRNDPRAWKFKKAKMNELEGLIKNKTWKIVSRENIPQNSNILNGRFVLTINDERTSKEVWKARFLVQGHKNRMK